MLLLMAAVVRYAVADGCCGQVPVPYAVADGCYGQVLYAVLMTAMIRYAVDDCYGQVCCC